MTDGTRGASPVTRRGLLTRGAQAALAGGTAMAASPAAAQSAGSPVTGAQASDGVERFGLVGDGISDDTAALQRVFDAAFAGRAARLVRIPPGHYKVSAPIVIRTAADDSGDITFPAGVVGDGAVLHSSVKDDGAVLDIEINSTVRYFRLEGLHIEGGREEGGGLRISCQRRGAYFYNFCLRDLVVEGCGGDGMALVGNLFEGQIINCYFRDNDRDGAVFAHGRENTVLSAVHLFGCVFGGNGRNGASLVDGAYDLSLQGCYLLLNGRFGLTAENGVTLLSHCGFENNHQLAADFSDGDYGLRLFVFGTLIGCTAYSIYNQKGLVRTYITNRLVMLGCTGAGDEAAGAAGLADLKGRKDAAYSLIGCYGKVAGEQGDEAMRAGSGGGLHLSRAWDSHNQLQLGPYRLWVDADGQLRMAHGAPSDDADGAVIGGGPTNG